MEKESKLLIANDIVKKYVMENSEKGSWRYVDFVNENRFMHEIESDKEIDIENSSSEEIAEYALDKIYESSLIEICTNALGYR